ncbi:MAG TPA: DUF5985 family protein [Kofleriaceae bacterium]|nr:DUF5985 family protein [Kofleriaceae bacterium]
MTAVNLATFLEGARTVFCVMIALSFAKLGRRTGDRLYHGFAIAFVLLAIGSLMIGLRVALGEYSVLVFVPRVLAFGLIIVAIVDKNRRARPPAQP